MPGHSPRPTRPRSWCRVARPKRSASQTIITVALGTSTPTSTTVVETSTCVTPERKSAMASSFSAADMRPVTMPTESSGNTRLRRRSKVAWAEWGLDVACSPSGTSSSSEPSSASSTSGHTT